MPTLGILMLQTRFARPPGDIGHPHTFAFAVRRHVVRGATPERVVRSGDPALLQPFVAAACELVAEGCSAIATSCGFLARWQRELQAALPVPVWSSALLQLAEEQARGRRCGVITIEAASLGAAHFEGVGADPATPVEGITPGSALHRTLLHDLPTLDEADAQAQVLTAAARLNARMASLQHLTWRSQRTRTLTALARSQQMTVLTASAARANLYRLIDQATESHQPIVIAGKKASAVLVSAEGWQAIQQTMHLFSVPGVPESIRKAMAEPLSKSARGLKWRGGNLPIRNRL